MNLKKQLSIYLFSALLWLFYISEAFGKIAIFKLGFHSSIPKYIKLIVFIFLGIMILKKKQYLIHFLLLGCCVVIGQYFIEDGFTMEMLTSYAKLLFPVVLFLYFKQNVILGKGLSLGFKSFEIILIINSCLIFTNLFFDSSLLSTYRGERFGHNGLLISSATSSYVYVIALYYFLMKYKRSFFQRPLSLLVLSSTFLLGTKVAYVAMLVIFIVYVVAYINLKKKQRIIALFGITALGMLAGYFFFFEFGAFNTLRMNSGLMTAVISGRNELFTELSLPYIKEQWSIIHYIVGGISSLTIRSQLGFIDVFLFWGALGSVIYIFLYLKSFIIFKLTRRNVIFLLLLFFIVFVSGNFFENASVAIYILIIREKIKQEQELNLIRNT